MAATSDVAGFIAEPSLGSLVNLSKVDLLALADYYNLTVDRQARKANLVMVIKSHLLSLSRVGVMAVEDVETEDETEDEGAVENPSPARSKGGVGGGEAPVPRTLPRYDPLSPASPESVEVARLKLKMARLEADQKDKEDKRRYEIEIRKIEADKEARIHIRRMELEAGVSPHPVGKPGHFDVGRNIAVVPPFRESEVDSYFSAFERVAAALQWPKDVWPLLLQCKLTGKAQEVVASLSIEDSLKYDVVKATVLRAYELVPEAYRQRFRNYKKSGSKTFVEFARDKESLFDRWCAANKTSTYQALRNQILLEDFKNNLPERIVMHLSENKVATLGQAAVLADEYALTHKTVFTASSQSRTSASPAAGASRSSDPPTVPRKEERECFYCHRKGHLISDCFLLKNKPKSPPPSRKSVGLTQSVSYQDTRSASEVLTGKPDLVYAPFVSVGSVSCTGKTEDQREIKILRDTGAAQSVILTDVLPWSEQTYCGSHILLCGIEANPISVPLHWVHLHSDLVSGRFRVGVLPRLAVEGVALLLGNDIAGGKVSPVLEVTDRPQSNVSDIVLFQKYPQVFPACVLTRAQARMQGDTVNLSDTIFERVETVDVELKPEASPSMQYEKGGCGVAPQLGDVLSSITSERLIEWQKEDVSLNKCFDSVVSLEKAKVQETAYLVDAGVLMRKWTAHKTGEDWDTVWQVVVPSPLRQQVLSLAHNPAWSGHLGVTKTYNRVLRHFFWPGLKSDIVQYCKTCHVCQLTGKVNQPVPRVPLHPIPVIGEPFERVIIDCVGPLPKTRTGNQFLLTIMCSATRYPEAIPLRTITAKTIIKSLIKFFSTFGLPRVIQTDQGTNFMSKLFSSALKTLSISHQVSSAYHPESQGALERWHQTLKTMLRKYCMETGADWDEGVPFVLFAVRETVQESLGFSPADLVFGHTPRGPLKVLKERVLLDAPSSTPKNVLHFVSQMRERLHAACMLAQESLSSSQSRMKKQYDKQPKDRTFLPGDQVLVLLPIPGSSLSASFSGPYVVERKVSDTNYVIKTPDRRRTSRLCHVNMLKAYHVRNSSDNPSSVPVQSEESSMALVVTVPTVDLEENNNDGLELRHSLQQCKRLSNSDMLQNLPSLMEHLDDSQKDDLVSLIQSFLTVFQDVPKSTSVLAHDVDVGSTSPIRQHPYRVNTKKRELMKSEVDYLLKHDMAKRSHSAWSSPCILVPKPDGTSRLCTDYRRVNAVTVPDSYPLPRIEDCIDRIGSAVFVSKLDLLKGYWQVPLTLRASDISAFVTPDNFVQYTVMPFGMCNAPATFQRLVNIVFDDIPTCTAYLDDVVIYSPTWAEHLSTLRLVFQRLENASLTLNLAKCEFGKATVTYLGKQVGRGQVRPIASKVDAIASYPAPKTRRQLRRFLGMVGYYRTFCKNFSTVVAPLTTLLSPKIPFKWSAECSSAFESAKALLCNAPVLTAPNFDKPFKLEVDASMVGAGAVLLQEDEEGVDRPISFFSRKFNPCQSRYSTIEQETLALLLALQFFEVYVGSSVVPVRVFTDHNPLTFLKRMYNQNRRLMRWALILQGYNICITHVKGTSNVVADVLSRVYQD